ncbi:MAG: leucyl aminopeptidase family protein [Chitinophagales bacterium]|nr:leucyl aminopeptidase family protein [Hyphomicrobiales bacterium]
MTPSLSNIRDEIASFFLPDDAPAAPLWLLNGRSDGYKRLSQPHQDWLSALNWKPAAGACIALPGETGIGGAVVGLGEDAHRHATPLIAGALSHYLPEGNYHFAEQPETPELAALAWAMGAYAFHEYHSAEKRGPRRLRLPNNVSLDAVLDSAQAVWLGRDLINTPANDCGPAELESAVRALAREFGAQVESVAGDDLLVGGFRLHHAVGRASDRAPRLIDLTWGQEGARRVTVIGKGVTFDTGGLDIKPASNMLLMKKDMGGAASAIALAAMIMAAKLPLRLRLLIPAADNNISANAFRPGDVIRSRNGATVEIGNTDAEGRLLLADAIDLANEDEPDTIVTLATLTGAARAALGPDLPPFYTDDEAFAAALAEASMRVGDPLWRMPFWSNYDVYLKSEIADMNNAGGGGFAGSIVAAMFLKRFVKKSRRFAHFDIYGWMPRALPGKPAGGEPQAARALFDVLAHETGMGR